ncbi:MAG: type II toxin-antitoxin system PemK/MazF family toxin [Candidatus Vogelbacteria bacterium]|nr:type II toxin-antitoxin system PemK/MazF family toxin [Candidatus Vogelbacteria bacterium]
MKKDFQTWHRKKEKVNNLLKPPFFHEREIWWCALGINVGFEQDGGGKDFLRPVVVFRKFNNEIFWAIPLTHTQKKTKYYFQVVFGEKFSSSAILSQVRLVDARRLSHKLGNLSDGDFLELAKRFKALLP